MNKLDNDIDRQVESVVDSVVASIVDSIVAAGIPDIRESQPVPIAPSSPVQVEGMQPFATAGQNSTSVAAPPVGQVESLQPAAEPPPGPQILMTSAPMGEVTTDQMVQAEAETNAMVDDAARAAGRANEQVLGAMAAPLKSAIKPVEESINAAGQAFISTPLAQETIVKPISRLAEGAEAGAVSGLATSPKMSGAGMEAMGYATGWKALRDAGEAIKDGIALETPEYANIFDAIKTPGGLTKWTAYAITNSLGSSAPMLLAGAIGAYMGGKIGTVGGAYTGNPAKGAALGTLIGGGLGAAAPAYTQAVGDVYMNIREEAPNVDPETAARLALMGGVPYALADMTGPLKNVFRALNVKKTTAEMAAKAILATAVKNGWIHDAGKTILKEGVLEEGIPEAFQNVVNYAAVSLAKEESPQQLIQRIVDNGQTIVNEGLMGTLGGTVMGSTAESIGRSKGEKGTAETPPPTPQAPAPEVPGTPEAPKVPTTPDVSEAPQDNTGAAPEETAPEAPPVAKPEAPAPEPSEVPGEGGDVAAPESPESSESEAPAPSPAPPPAVPSDQEAPSDETSEAPSPEQQPEEEEDIGTIEAPNTAALAKRMQKHLVKPRVELDANKLRAWVQEQYGDTDPDKYSRKVAEEALEYAIVREGREIAQGDRGDAIESSVYKDLVSLYDEWQPNLAGKTSESVSNQAYSTPLPMSYIAAKLAGINSATTVYEPTAGNGSLLITANPENVTVNEIDERRRSHLADLVGAPVRVLNKDAATYTPAENTYERIIANPPFGAYREGSGEGNAVVVDGYRMGKIDHIIAARALNGMRQDGKAVLIIGAPKVEGTPWSSTDRTFQNWLYANYNVAGHFEASGDLYSKQGAGWPVQIITIEGRRESPGTLQLHQNIPRYNTWDELQSAAERIINERTNADVGDGGPGAGGDVGGAQQGGAEQGGVPRKGGADDQQGGSGAPQGERPGGDEETSGDDRQGGGADTGEPGGTGGRSEQTGGDADSGTLEGEDGQEPSRRPDDEGSESGRTGGNTDGDVAPDEGVTFEKSPDLEPKQKKEKGAPKQKIDPFKPGRRVTATSSIDPFVAQMLEEMIEIVGVDPEHRMFVYSPRDVSTNAEKQRLGLVGLYEHVVTEGQMAGAYAGWHAFYQDENRAPVPHYDNRPQGLSDDSAIALGNEYDKLTNMRAKIEIVAHELGHALQAYLYSKASPDVQEKIYNAYLDFKERMEKAFDEGVTYNEYKKYQRMRVFSLRKNPDGDTLMSKLKTERPEFYEYVTSFPEWLADNVSRWYTSREAPLTAVERFYDRVAQALRNFFQKIRDLAAGKISPKDETVRQNIQRRARWLADKTVEEWLNERVEETGYRVDLKDETPAQRRRRRMEEIEQRRREEREEREREARKRMEEEKGNGKDVLPPESQEMEGEESQYQAKYQAMSTNTADPRIRVPANIEKYVQDGLSGVVKAIKNDEIVHGVPDDVRNSATDGDLINWWVRDELGFHDGIRDDRENIYGLDFEGKGDAEIEEAVDRAFKRAFLAHQVDALALAIYQHRKKGAFVLGDQTGVGKGRVVAGFMIYAKHQGFTPTFLTARADLFDDILRDYQGIGVAAPNFFTFNNTDIKYKKDGKVYQRKVSAEEHRQELDNLAQNHKEYDAVLCTYSQIQNSRQLRKPDALFRLINASPFLNLDEAHKGAGKSNTFRLIMELLRDADGVLYSSATFAKRAENLTVYGKTDMAKATGNDMVLLQYLLDTSGTPMQEVITAMLAKGGQYIRRERDMSGITLDMHVVDSKEEVAKHKEIGDAISRGFTSITKFDRAKEGLSRLLERIVEMGGADLGAPDINASLSQVSFVSRLHNLVGQALLAIKADAVVDKAIEAHNAGEKPIVALDKTNESFLSYFVNDESLAPGATLKDFTFKTNLIRALRSTLRFSFRDAFGNSARHVYFDFDDIDAFLRQVDPTGTASGLYDRVYEAAEALKPLYEKTEDELQSLPLDDLPPSPIDYIKNKLEQAGISMGEITGRTAYIEYGEDGAMRYQQRSNSDKDKSAQVTTFNNDTVRGLLINKSAAEGLSMHASPDETGLEDPDARHMLVAEANPDINDFVQILGRIDRTGQVKDPKYTIVLTTLPAEMRPAIVLQKKMSSLMATTTAKSKSVLALKDTPDMMNHHGDMIVYQYLRENPAIRSALFGTTSMNDIEAVGIFRKASGRTVLLPVSEQEQFFSDIISDYNDHIKSLNAAGTNDLVSTVEDLDAEVVNEEVLHTGTPGDTSPFAAPAVLQLVSAKRKGRPMTLDEIRERLDANAIKDGLIEEGKKVTSVSSGQEILSMAMKRIRNVLDEYIEKERHDDPDFSDVDAEALVNAFERNIWGEYSSTGFLNTIIDAYGKTVHLFTAAKRGNREYLYMGILTRVYLKRPNKAGNPVTPSNIVMEFAVSSPQKIVQMPMSKVINDVDLVQRYYAEGGDMTEAFEGKEATAARENRYIITGNIITGFAVAAGRGKIVSFTRKGQKATEMGILMPKKWKPEDTKQQGKILSNAEQVHDAIVEDSQIVKTSDNVVQIWPRADNVAEVRVAAASKHKNVYGTDSAIYKALGNRNLEKRGNSMRATIRSSEELKAVIEAVYSTGRGFSVKLPDEASLAADLDMGEDLAIELNMAMDLDIEDEGVRNFLENPRKAPQEKTLRDRLREDLLDPIGRTFIYERDIKKIAPKLVEAIRNLEAAIDAIVKHAAQKMEYVLSPLRNPKDFKLWEIYVTLKDLAERGADPEYVMPQDVTREGIESELAKLEARDDEQMDMVRDAAGRFWDMWKDVAEDLVNRGLLDEASVKSNYSPHVVIDFINREITGETSPLRFPFRGEVMKAGGTERLHENALDASMRRLAQVERHNLIDDFIYKAIKEYGEKYSPKRKTPPHEGWKLYQFRNGRYYYRVEVVTKKTLAEELKESAEQALGKDHPEYKNVVARIDDLATTQSILGVGGLRDAYWVPPELHDRFTRWREPRDRGFLRAMNTLTRWTKVIQIGGASLLSMYNATNFIGDFENTILEDILAPGKVPESIRAQWKAHQGDYTIFYQEALDRGVINSGFTHHELVRIVEKNPRLRRLVPILEEGETYWRHGPKKAWHWAIQNWMRAMRARENTLRLALYMRLRERGMSAPVAAKRAREALVDYGRQTDSERTMFSGFLFPYYTWKVNNTLLWMRYAKEHPAKFFAKSPIFFGAKMAKLGLRWGLAYKLVAWLAPMVAWNNIGDDDDDEKGGFLSKFAQWGRGNRTIEENLPEWIKEMPHIVLGRDYDGVPIVWSLPMAADDFLQTTGLGRVLEAESVGDVALALVKGPGDTVVQMFTSVIKGPLEAAFNVDTFRNYQPIARPSYTSTGGKTYPRESTDTVFGIKVNPRVIHLMNSWFSPLRYERYIREHFKENAAKGRPWWKAAFGVSKIPAGAGYLGFRKVYGKKSAKYRQRDLASLADKIEEDAQRRGVDPIVAAQKHLTEIKTKKVPVSKLVKELRSRQRAKAQANMPLKQRAEYFGNKFAKKDSADVRTQAAILQAFATRAEEVGKSSEAQRLWADADSLMETIGGWNVTSGQKAGMTRTYNMMYNDLVKTEKEAQR